MIIANADYEISLPVYMNRAIIILSKASRELEMKQEVIEYVGTEPPIKELLAVAVGSE
jgi:hypothetical protein